MHYFFLLRVITPVPGIGHRIRLLRGEPANCPLHLSSSLNTLTTTSQFFGPHQSLFLDDNNRNALNIQKTSLWSLDKMEIFALWITADFYQKAKSVHLIGKVRAIKLCLLTKLIFRIRTTEFKEKSLCRSK